MTKFKIVLDTVCGDVSFKVEAENDSSAEIFAQTIMAGDIPRNVNGFRVEQADD